MIEQQASTSNPLAAFAASVRAPVALAVSVGARLVGAGLAVLIAVTESYDPTQTFAGALAAIVAVSVAGHLTALRHWLATFGAGALFFGGSILWSVDAGIAVLVSGGVACISALIAAWHDGEALMAPLIAFFASGFLMAATVVLVILTVEG